MFNLKTNQWSENIAKNSSMLKHCRRHHCAEVVGNYLIVYGGVGISNKPIGDVVQFDLCSGVWSDIPLNI